MHTHTNILELFAISCTSNCPVTFHKIRNPVLLGSPADHVGQQTMLRISKIPLMMFLSLPALRPNLKEFVKLT